MISYDELDDHDDKESQLERSMITKIQGNDLWLRSKQLKEKEKFSRNFKFLGENKTCYRDPNSRYNELDG